MHLRGDAVVAKDFHGMMMHTVSAFQQDKRFCRKAGQGQRFQTVTIGSWIATRIMFLLGDEVKLCIIAVLTVLVIILTLITGWIKIEKNTRRRIEVSIKSVLTCAAVGFGLGLYDGFFGPGGGTVALLLFALFLKLDMRVGGGIGKLIVVTSNFTGMIAYILKGEVRYAIALPCAAVNIIGSYVGASLATNKGAGFVKYISWAVVAMLLIQTISKFMS